MLFKLSISLITYLLNPDEFTKGEKGFGTIIKNSIFALVMVVLCPYIFTEAYELQAIILEENTIMNLAFGSPENRELSNANYASSAGDKIRFTLLYAFAKPNYEEFAYDKTYDLIDCKYTYDRKANGEYTFREKAHVNGSSQKESKFIYNLDPSCWGIYDPENDKYIEDGTNGQLAKAFKSIDAESAYQEYAQGVAQQSASLFFKKAVIIDAVTEDGRYLIDYKGGISTIVGGATLYLLFLFCIDVAVRSVKLGFLQMIAPIPILSYVDPKSGKDGMFNKWFKVCKDTYLDLFIRLFALYFGLYVITLVGKFRDVGTGEIIESEFTQVFMIIGILIFVKKLPDFLKDALGFSGGTFKDFNLNPLKRFEDQALGGKRITGAVAGAAVGGIGNAVSLFQEGHRNPFGLAAGLAGGALRGARTGALENKGWHAQRDRQAEMNRKILTPLHLLIHYIACQ